MQLSKNAIRVLEERYLIRNEQGETIETPEQLFKRVATAIATPETDNQHCWYEDFYRIMSELLFLPNTPTLFNAGRSNGHLSACFVLPVDDSIKSIFTTLQHTALIHQGGGGTGFNFSNIRPKGSPVRSTTGVANGPLAFMKVFDAATGAVKQGGNRRGGNMGILDITHPDIESFINAKRTEGVLSNFNLSVGIRNDWMDLCLDSEPERLNLLKLIATAAWEKGEPGIIFLDRLGDGINATNPCFTGETKVETMFGKMAFRDMVGKEIPVLTLQDDKSLTYKFMRNIRKMRSSVKVIRIMLNNGKSFTCTPDHQIFTQNMQPRSAGLFEVGDSVSSLQIDSTVLYTLTELRNIHSKNHNSKISHQVESVEYLTELKDVYCGTVDETGRFYLAAGVLVSNCGEQPLEPYESCNLGSINLAKFVIDGQIDFEGLRQLIPIAVRFLDNVITINTYPLPLIQEVTSKNRKIGLGVMGFADMLAQMGVAYDTKDGRRVATRVAEFIQAKAEAVSLALGEEKGAYPANQASTKRNKYVTTIAPTGSLSIIANCSSGIEPYIALAYTRHQAGIDMIEKNRYISEHISKELDTTIWQYVIDHDGSVQGCSDLSETTQSWFKTAKDINPDAHVKMQAAWQGHIDNAVSKCVAKGTLIATNKGLLPIEHLGQAKGEDNFDRALPNTFVLDKDGKVKRITNHYSGGVRVTYKIRLNNGNTLEVAENHKLETLEGFKKAKDITTSDLLVYNNSTINTPGKIELFQFSIKRFKLPTRMSLELALWFGMLAADGSFNEDSGFVGIYSKTESTIAIFARLIRILFGIESKRSTDKNKVMVIFVNSRDLYRWVTVQMGEGAYNKYIPDCILQGNREEQLEYIKGLNLDGYRKNQGLVIYEGVSRQLNDQLFSIAVNLGLRPLKQSRKSKYKGKQFYVHSTYTDCVLQTIDKHKQITTVIPRKVLVPVPSHVYTMQLTTKHSEYRNLLYIKKCKPKYTWNTTLDKLSVLYDKTKHLLKVTHVVQSRSEVYDIEVADSHTYLIDGIVSHNTVNLPNDATVEDVEQIYIQAYRSGCKGITVYRDRSRDGQVLETRNERTGDVSGVNEVSVGDSQSSVLPPGSTQSGSVVNSSDDHYPAVEDVQAKGAKRKRPEIVSGDTTQVTTACGKLYITINVDNEQHPFELFCNMGKAGGCEASQNEALGRIISLTLKSGVSPKKIADQLINIRCDKPYGIGSAQIKSCADAIAKILVMRSLDTLSLSGGKKGTPCPDCGCSLEHVENCAKCPYCGYSRCG